MAILKQGAQYNDSSEPVEHIEPAPTEEPEEKAKKKLPLPILVGGLVVVFIIVVLVYAKLSGGLISPTSKDNPDSDPNPIVADEDDYWDDFEEVPPPVFAYTADEIASLRAWGYTGDEIEAKALENVPAATLIAESKKQQEEALKSLGDVTSPEYQELLNNTWLGQSPTVLPVYEEGVTESLLTYTTRTYNADYSKVPAHGCTLFLKVFLPDGSYAFMECAPLRYMQLPETGNIVVTYTEIGVGETTIIAHMTEVAVG